MVARNNSVSKNSAARSATAIGPQRNSRYISFLASFRIAQPVRSIAGVLSAFDDERLEASLGEIEGSNQAIVSASNDNNVSLLGHELRRPFEIFKDFQGGQPSVRAHNSAARMGCRSAHVEILDRRAISRPARNRTQEEKLLQRQLALKNVAFAQAELALQVERGQHLLVEDDFLQVGRVFGNGIDHIVAEILALRVPVQLRT